MNAGLKKCKLKENEIIIDGFKHWLLICQQGEWDMYYIGKVKREDKYPVNVTKLTPSLKVAKRWLENLSSDLRRRDLQNNK